MTKRLLYSQSMRMLNVLHAYAYFTFIFVCVLRGKINTRNLFWWILWMLFLRVFTSNKRKHLYIKNTGRRKCADRVHVNRAKKSFTFHRVFSSSFADFVCSSVYFMLGCCRIRRSQCSFINYNHNRSKMHASIRYETWNSVSLFCLFCTWLFVVGQSLSAHKAMAHVEPM